QCAVDIAGVGADHHEGMRDRRRLRKSRQCMHKHGLAGDAHILLGSGAAHARADARGGKQTEIACRSHAMQLESDARKIDAEPGWEITNECVEKIAEETSREGMMSVRAAPDSNGGLVYN